MKKMYFLILCIAMALVLAGCSTAPCEGIAQSLSRLRTYEDMIENVSKMAELVLDMAEEEIDANIFADMGSGRYAIPAYYDVGEARLECALLCENAKVTALELALTGSGVTPAEFDEILSCAAAKFGADYTFAEADDAKTYTWAHLVLTCNAQADGANRVVVTYA